MHTEATVTNNVKIITPAGYNHLVTIRQGATETEIKTHLETIRRLDAAFEKMNWQPAEGKRRPPAGPSPSSNGNGHHAERSSTGSLHGSNGNHRFPCQSLACTVESGKQYWKVSDAGGRWKYPVIIYPEVLKQFFNLDNLDPGTVYSLTDWEATYLENEKGYPRKITALHPPGNVEPQAPVTPAPHQVRDATPQPGQRPEAAAEMLQHSNPPRYQALVAAQGAEDEIPF